MARIRSIKPDFFSNEGLATVSESAQLLAAGLLCYADDEGYFNAHPGLVKAAVFPLRDPLESIEACMAALVKIGYIQLGTGIDCKRYGHVVKFLDHQRVSHPIPSKIKAMRVVWEVSGEIPESSVKPQEVGRPELNGIELNGTDKNLKPSPQKARRAISRSSQLAVASAENKHQRITGMVIAAWNEHNPGATCPFGDADGKQVKLMLQKTTGWPDSNYSQCLQNLYATEGFPRSELPMYFLPRLPSYFSGPKDRYNRELSNGAGNSKADRRNADISATTRSVFDPSRHVFGDNAKSLPDKTSG